MSLNILSVTLAKFLTYFHPILFTFCMIGSCLDILLFSRRRFRTVSCCIYFLAAAVVIAIQFGFLCGVLTYAYHHVNPITSIAAMCKIYMYVQQFTAMIQRWLMAAATFDRYACSSNSAILRRFSTVRVARRVVLAIVAIWLVIPVYRLVFYDIRPNDCDIFGNVVALIHSIYTAIAGIIPLLIMVPSLVLIQRNLADKRQRRRQIGVQQKEGRNEAQELDRKRDQQVLAILLIQVIAYIILVTPLLIVQIYDAITLPISNKSINRLIIEQFVFNIADTLASIYSAIPFYLSTIMSRMFRDELAIVVRKLFHCRWLTNAIRVEPLAINIKAKALPAISYSIQLPVSRLVAPNGNMIVRTTETDSKHDNKL